MNVGRQAKHTIIFNRVRKTRPMDPSPIATEKNTSQFTPRTLSRETRKEIFQTSKGHLRRPVNYVNYSRGDHNIITHYPRGELYDEFLSQMADY